MNKEEILISIVSPIYKGEKMLDELVSRIESSVETITKDYEIILVNDCSPDDSWTKMKEICAHNKKVKGVNLSRNFGQHYAITAGLTKSKGEWVVVMDCDLQDRPEEIPNLYQKTLEGYDIVLAQRVDRHDSWFKKNESRCYHLVLDFLTGTKSDGTVANFGIYNRKVIDAILSMGDAIRNFPRMVQWVGFKKSSLPVKHAIRAEGKSGYTFLKALRLATDNLIGFSDRILRLVLQFGFGVFLCSLVVASFYFVKYMFGGIGISGFTTLVISLWLLSGIIIMLIGVVGLYIGKIFDRVKGRPLFIVDELLNYDEE